MDRARQRGDIPGRPDPGTVADIVFGTIWYRILATGQPFDDQLIEDLVAMLTRAERLSARQAPCRVPASGRRPQVNHPVAPGEARASDPQSLRDQLIRAPEVGGHDALESGRGQDPQVN